jgi:hypothetical protein
MRTRGAHAFYVLCYIAKHGPSTKYKIEHGLRDWKHETSDVIIPHATIHNVVQELQQTGAIKVVKTERSRVGLKMEHYELRLIGLIYVIQCNYVFALKQLDLDVIAAKYRSELPLIFGKWELLKTMPEVLTQSDRMTRLGFRHWIHEYLSYITWQAFDLPSWIHRVRTDMKTKQTYTARLERGTVASRFSGQFLSPPGTITLTDPHFSSMANALADRIGVLIARKSSKEKIEDALQGFESFMRHRLLYTYFFGLHTRYMDRSYNMVCDNPQTLAKLDSIWKQDPEIHDYIKKYLNSQITIMTGSLRQLEDRTRLYGSAVAKE